MLFVRIISLYAFILIIMLCILYLYKFSCKFCFSKIKKDIGYRVIVCCLIC